MSSHIRTKAAAVEAPPLGFPGRLLDSSLSAVCLGIALTGALAWLLRLNT